MAKRVNFYATLGVSRVLAEVLGAMIWRKARPLIAVTDFSNPKIKQKCRLFPSIHNTKPGAVSDSVRDKNRHHRNGGCLDLFIGFGPRFRHPQTSLTSGAMLAAGTSS